MRALLAQAAFVKDQNAISVLDGAQAMRDHQRGSSGKQLVQRFADQLLGLRIDARRCFVQNQETRIVRQSSGEVDQLALPDGEG